MSRREIETILKQVEQLLATAGPLPAEAEEAVEKLLNVVESVCSHNQTLLDEVKRIRLEQKKKEKAQDHRPAKPGWRQKAERRFEPLVRKATKADQEKPPSTRPPHIQRPHDPRYDRMSRGSFHAAS